jgi:hypothetical protein
MKGVALKLMAQILYLGPLELSGEFIVDDHIFALLFFKVGILSLL